MSISSAERRGSIAARSMALFFTAGLGLTFASSAPAGDDCSAAKQATEQAQQALSKATRDADTRADAYAQCMAGGSGCQAKKAAYDAALAAKTRASAAMKAASARRQTVCP